MAAVSEQRCEEIVRELRHISGHPPEWATSGSGALDHMAGVGR